MRISFVLLYVCMTTLFAENSYSQKAKVTINQRNTDLEDVLHEIENQTSYLFLYNGDKINLSEKVSVKVKDKPVDELLNDLFSDKPIGYVLEGTHIVLQAEERTNANRINQQNITITGTVVDDLGEPLPGVNITLKGTTTGTVTDVNGNYSIAVSGGNSVLSFSFIGYQTQEIIVSGQRILNVTLLEDTRIIDEIVVIGYGTVKKSDLTGAVTSVRSKDFGDRSAGAGDIGQLLAGKASGVQVTDGQIHVRGVTTINNTNPLYVVDGYVDAPANTVHPSDIESIEVLKDASSTAIYGAKGANGVILITTKKGKIGKPQIDFNTFLSVGMPMKRYDLLKSRDYMDLLTDIKLNGGTNPQDLYKYDKLYNPDGSYTDYVLQDRTDWDKEIQGSSFSQEYSINIRGGSEKAIYSVNGAFNNNNITNGTQNSKVYILGENTEFKLFKDRLKIGQSVRMRYSYSDGGVAEIGGMRMPSYAPVYDDTGTSKGGYGIVTPNTDLTDGTNPIAKLDPDLIDTYSRSLRVMAQFTGELTIFPWLKFNSTFGINIQGSTWYEYAKVFQASYIYDGESRLRENMTYELYPRLENYLTFSKTVGIHDITAMIGNSYEKNGVRRHLGVDGKGFDNDELSNVLRAHNSNILEAEGSKRAYLSYFGRINYSLLNRYLLTFNFRADGSPNFGPSNRWGYFPSIAAAWKLHEESFMKDADWLDQLKIRGSYGKTGNDAIDPYLYYSSIHSNPSYAFPSHGLTSVNYNGATITSLANAAIKWEETENISVGVDLGFLRNRLQVSADYFVKNSYDILFAVPQAPSLGLGLYPGDGNAMRNAADVTNKGFEFNISYNGKAGDLSYQVSGNGTYVKNEVTGLGNGEPYTGSASYVGAATRTEKGYPIGYFYGYKMDKVYATQAEVDADNAKAPGGIYDMTSNGQSKAGDIRFVDVNGDGIVNDDDRTNLGSSIPKFSYGFSAFLQYKDFDFNMAWYGAAGNKILYSFEYLMDGMINPFNTTTNVLNRWRSEANPGNGKVPRAVESDPGKNTRMSDRYVYNGSYFRLDLISLGYTLPKKWMSQTNGLIENVRVYVSSDKPFTITSYPGVDPVIGLSDDKTNTVRGIDGGKLNARTVRFGLSVKF